MIKMRYSQIGRGQIAIDWDCTELVELYENSTRHGGATNVGTENAGNSECGVKRSSKQQDWSYPQLAVNSKQYLHSSLMLCLAWVKTSRGPTKSMASMPACSVNNTLMIGTESVAAMIATGCLCRGCMEVWWLSEGGKSEAFDAGVVDFDVCVGWRRKEELTGRRREVTSTGVVWPVLTWVCPENAG